MSNARTGYDKLRNLTYILPVVDRTTCECEGCTERRTAELPSGLRRIMEELDNER